MANALFSPYSGYILDGATWSSTVSPITGYSITDFAFLRPDWRIKWNVKALTITASLGSSKLADVAAVPMSNLDPGTSPTILRLTNGAGLDVQIELPLVPPDHLPLTAVLDLRGLASAGTRTSNAWHWIIANNSVDVTMGAALWLGTLTAFTDNFRPGFVLGDRRFNGAEPNVFGVPNRVRTRTRERYAEFAVPSRNTQRDAFFAWARAGEGSALPSLFWPDPSVNDALLGSWPDEYASTWVIHNYSPMDAIRFTEWNKGIPLL